MLQDDRAQFDVQIGILLAAYGVYRSDERIGALWKGLNRLSLVELVRCIDHMIARDAEAGTKRKEITPGDVWDARRELRTGGAPGVVTPADPLLADARLAGAARSNAAMWKQLLEEDPERHELELGIARCARIVVTEHESSNAYAEARRLDFQYREKLYGLHYRRSKAPLPPKPMQQELVA